MIFIERRNSGFTLVEVSVAIACIGMLIPAVQQVRVMTRRWNRMAQSPTQRVNANLEPVVFFLMLFSSPWWGSGP
ncbi:MAG: type II secretion system protein [Pirellulales bacterium]